MELGRRSRPGERRDFVFRQSPAPEISGDAQILDAHLKPPPLWPDLSHLNAEVRFASKEAALDPIRFQVDAKPVSLVAA